jgi:integrase
MGESRGEFGWRLPAKNHVSSDRIKGFLVSAVGVEPITPHDLRHTAASWAAIAGAQADELREAFGWKTLAMTGRYVGRAGSLGRSGVKRAAEAIRNAHRGSASDRQAPERRKLDCCRFRGH